MPKDSRRGARSSPPSGSGGGPDQCRCIVKRGACHGGESERDSDCVYPNVVTRACVFFVARNSISGNEISFLNLNSTTHFPLTGPFAPPACLVEKWSVHIFLSLAGRILETNCTFAPRFSREPSRRTTALFIRTSSTDFPRQSKQPNDFLPLRFSKRTIIPWNANE